MFTILLLISLVNSLPIVYIDKDIQISYPLTNLINGYTYYYETNINTRAAIIMDFNTSIKVQILNNTNYVI